jgi:hypothetical protein
VRRVKTCSPSWLDTTSASTPPLRIASSVCSASASRMRSSASAFDRPRLPRALRGS